MSCRPSSAETDLPYAGLGDLFARVDDSVMKALPAPRSGALDVALLRVDTGTSPLEQRAVSAAFHVLVELARSAPVLLAIDDLQWLDRPTVNVLRFALRRIAPARRRARCEPLEPVRRRSARAGGGATSRALIG